MTKSNMRGSNLSKKKASTMESRKKFKEKLTDTQKLKLIRSTLKAAYKNTESWRDCGCALTYLIDAISRKGPHSVDYPKDSPELEELYRIFGPKHPARKYICQH